MPAPAIGDASSSLRCRRCRKRVTPTNGSNWACSEGHEIPVVAGILDFRSSSHDFDVATDRQLAEELSALDAESFEGLLRGYWDRQPGISSRDADRFVTGDLIAGERAAEVADQIELLLDAPLSKDALAVEVGGGTGALGAELARRCSSVIVTDISLAWLVLARRRLRDMGLDNVMVIAATGDDLPVDTSSMDLIVAADVIEHVPDREAMVSHCYAALRPGGALWMSTPNRFSLTPEPHVRLWGVGLLPRRLGRAYVERRRNVRRHRDGLAVLVTTARRSHRRFVEGDRPGNRSTCPSNIFADAPTRHRRVPFRAPCARLVPGRPHDHPVVPRGHHSSLG